MGDWLRRERELRGVPLTFLSVRSKLPVERLRAIEDGGLEPDGRGRATARALAAAIGADPDEAVRLLARSERAAGLPRPRAGRARRWRRVVAAVAALAAAAALLAWLWLPQGSAADLPDVVYRPDYVRRLLGDRP